MKNTDSKETKKYISGEIYYEEGKVLKPYRVIVWDSNAQTEEFCFSTYAEALELCRIDCQSFKVFSSTPSGVDVQTYGSATEGKETMSTMPSHYHPGMVFTETAQIQEYVNNNILKSGQYDEETRNRIALWAGMALKHLLRLGLKDDMLVEIRKSENYCHRAIKGEWINDK